jgi:hypothetical protein
MLVDLVKALGEKLRSGQNRKRNRPDILVKLDRFAMLSRSLSSIGSIPP